MAKVLLTGGAGYVGSHVAKAIAKAGHELLVVDNLTTGFRSLAKYGTFQELDILNLDALCALVKKFQPEAVLHFAARATVGESVAQPDLYYRINVQGSLHLLTALQKHAPKAKCIFSSSCAVYAPTNTPLTENHAYGPVSPYGRTKLIMEEMLQDFSAASDLRYISLRYFNAAGADREGEIGEMHDPETHLIPRLLLKCRDSSFEDVKIFGNDYPTPDGTCIRDYIHVEDLASAHMQAMDYLLRGGQSQAFNLGSAKGYSVLEVIAMVEKITGKKLPRSFAPRRSGDPAQLIADSSKIKSVLGWEPACDLQDIISTAWRWTQKL